VTGRVVNPDAVYAFAAFGPPGRDGVVGTADDLADPFAPFTVKK
jgi:hypothetical protein